MSSPNPERDLPEALQPEGGTRLKRALLALAFVTAGGTAGFVHIEGWSLWDSFYFTLITITTVGYGDGGLSEAGRKFASLLLIGGVATASYAFAVIIQESVARQLAWRKRMQKRIDSLEGHTLVCGFGRMGRSICERLTDLGVTPVVMDLNTESFTEAVSLGYLAIEGSSTEDDTLQRAGIERCSHLVAAVDSIGDNIVITMSARELRPDLTIIARAERNEDVRKLKRAGADRVICPFKSGGGEVANLITQPGVAEFLDRAQVAGGNVALGELTVGNESHLIGRSLGEYGKNEGTRISFVALERTGQEVCIPPRGAEEILAGDHLIVAGDPTQIAEMKRQAHANAAA